MSEHEPSPERKIQPLFDDCMNCDARYQLNPENAGARHYPGQAECDYIICKCPNCKYITRIFVGAESMQDARDNGLTVHEDEKYAEPDIYDRWCQVNGIELPKTYELTDRHEAIIRKFGENLLAVPDDIFWDNIEADPGKPYPLKWID